MYRTFFRTFIISTALSFLLPTLAFTNSCSSSSDASCTSHPKHNTDNTLGPNLKIISTPFRISDCSIFSLLAEGGLKNGRFGATFGYFVSPKIHFKISAEQLYQKINFSFNSGNSPHWISQYAFGGAIEYAFCNRYLNSIELIGSYSYCRGRKLSTKPCCVSETQLLNNIYRHIAGGSDGFAGIGITLTPWYRGTLSLAADYDCVTYNRKFFSNHKVSGFGGTAKFNQMFRCGVSIDLKGEMRRPFNYYEGAINWTNVHPYGMLTVGIYTGYTKGRWELPNNWTSGLLISADFGGIPFYSKYRDCPPAPCRSGTCLNPCFPLDSELVAWVSTPAVRMPTVIAVSEQTITGTDNPCPAPTPPVPPVCKAPISVTIPAQFTLPFDTSAFFDPNGHLIRYSAKGLGPHLFIDPISGIIHGDIEDISIRVVTVTGTTECGSTSETFEIINPYGGYPYGPY